MRPHFGTLSVTCQKRFFPISVTVSDNNRCCCTYFLLFLGHPCRSLCLFFHSAVSSVYSSLFDFDILQRRGNCCSTPLIIKRKFIFPCLVHQRTTCSIALGYPRLRRLQARRGIGVIGTRYRVFFLVWCCYFFPLERIPCTSARPLWVF